jgi:hypothetical protein
MTERWLCGAKVLKSEGWTDKADAGLSRLSSFRSERYPPLILQGEVRFLSAVVCKTNELGC